MLGSKLIHISSVEFSRPTQTAQAIDLHHVDDRDPFILQSQ